MHVTTVDQARSDWLSWLPVPEHRSRVAGIMADTITRAHAGNPGCWMVSYKPHGPYLNINVGPLFAFSVYVGELSVLLDTSVLPASALPDHWRGGKYEKRFKTIPEATWTRGPTAEVLARWDQLEASYLSAVDKAIATGSTPPWWRHHDPNALQFLREESGISLPQPKQPAQAAVADEDLPTLIAEFADAYANSQVGREHARLNREADAAFRDSFAALRSRRRDRDDITVDVLTKLLPHSRNPGNIERGAWITMAPVLHTDIRKFLEASGKAKPEDWPTVAGLLMDLFETCADHPAQLAEACQRFADNNPVKGMQSGMLSPGLAILNPDVCGIINRKPLTVIQRFLGRKHTPKLVEYADANADLMLLVEQTREGFDAIASLDGLPSTMKFDMFTHWLVAVRVLKETRYWKIAPGEQAFNWDECLSKGVITMGWEKFGDLSEITSDEFDVLAKQLAAQEDDYSPGGTPQLWIFAKDIHIGDHIIANKGLSRILGVGRVTGEYFFEPDVIHGHRLPVEWQDFTPIDVPKQGWMRTIVQLGQKKFEDLLGVVPPPTESNCWLFQANPKLFNLEHELQVEGADTIDRWKVATFREKMKPGDTVYLWQSGKKAGIYAVAELTGPVFEVTKETADEFSDPGGHKVPLRVTRVLDAPITRAALLDMPEFENFHILKAPFGTNFKVTADEWAALRKLIEIVEPPKPVVPTVPDIAAQTGFSEVELTRWINAIHRKGQAVLYGPPGTGKTYVADLLARHLAGTDGFVDLVQFHPAYTYEDFLQGLRPVLSPSGGLDYRLVPGRFLEFCAKASRRKGPCVLILDEINRANLARVFGELMYLLEYRNHTVPLAAGGELSIPQNVRIIGTMNTADRSIALVDHALRRRFAFIHLRPQYAVLEKFHQGNGYDGAALVKVLKRLNQAIDDPHYEVGISFFLNKNLGANLEDIWRMEIEPYLEEYFFDQAAKAREFSWDKLKPELQ